MNLTCAALAATLKTMTAAASISVVGACPAYIDIMQAPPGLTLDFTAAPIVRIDIRNVSNLVLKGVVSTQSQFYGIVVANSKNVTVVGPQIDHPGTAGIDIIQSDSVEISAPTITRSLGDGIDVVGSTNVNIHDGACLNNVATVIHPDCIQTWSVPGYQTQHLLIQRMKVLGATQGFDNFGDDTGHYDFRILDNELHITYANCIVYSGVTGLVVSGNKCVTIPGMNQGLASVRISNSPGAQVSNNTSS